MGAVCCGGSASDVEYQGKGGTFLDDHHENIPLSSKTPMHPSTILEDGLLGSGVLILLTSLSGMTPTVELLIAFNT